MERELEWNDSWLTPFISFWVSEFPVCDHKHTGTTIEGGGGSLRHSCPNIFPTARATKLVNGGGGGLGSGHGILSRPMIKEYIPITILLVGMRLLKILLTSRKKKLLLKIKCSALARKLAGKSQGGCTPPPPVARTPYNVCVLLAKKKEQSLITFQHMWKLAPWHWSEYCLQYHILHSYLL